MSTGLLIVVGAEYLFLVVPAAALIYWISAPPAIKRYLIFFGFIVGVLSVIIGQVIAHFYFDPRPFVTGHFQPLIPHGADNGFPSDHTLLSSVIAATVTATNASLGIVLWVITAAVAVARVAAGLHRPVDVIGSGCIAAISAAIAWLLLRSRFDTPWRS